MTIIVEIIRVKNVATILFKVNSCLNGNILASALIGKDTVIAVGVIGISQRLTIATDVEMILGGRETDPEACAAVLSE
jgi:hypothetical protein